MVIVVVIGDGTGSFKTVNLEVFKLKKEKLFVLISITWYTDTLIPEVSYEPNCDRFWENRPKRGKQFFSVSPGKALWVDFFQKKLWQKWIDTS